MSGQSSRDRQQQWARTRISGAKLRWCISDWRTRGADLETVLTELQALAGRGDA